MYIAYYYYFYYFKPLVARRANEKINFVSRGIVDLDNGRQLETLRRTAKGRSKWREGVDAIVEEASARWTQRNEKTSRQRAAEKKTYENKRKGEDNNRGARQRRQSKIDQYFR